MVARGTLSYLGEKIWDFDRSKRNESLLTRKRSKMDEFILIFRTNGVIFLVGERITQNGKFQRSHRENFLPARISHGIRGLTEESANQIESYDASPFTRNVALVCLARMNPYLFFSTYKCRVNDIPFEEIEKIPFSESDKVQSGET